jgi:hypothetical protein
MKKASQLLIFIAIIALAPVLAGAQEVPNERVARIYQKNSGDNYLMTVHRSATAARRDFFRNLFIYFGGFNLLESFNIPEDIELQTRIFNERADLENYLLTQYLYPIFTESNTTPPETPTRQVCPTVSEDSDDVAPSILIALPNAGPAFLPIAISGVNFGSGAVPYFNSTPSLSLFNFSTQNIPLIGSVSVGFTLVPPAISATSSDLTIEYCGQRSNPFPFEVR